MHLDVWKKSFFFLATSQKFSFHKLLNRGNWTKRCYSTIEKRRKKARKMYTFTILQHPIRYLSNNLIPSIFLPSFFEPPSLQWVPPHQLWEQQKLWLIDACKGLVLAQFVPQIIAGQFWFFLGIFLTANFYCQCHLAQTFKRSLKIAFKICFFLCYFFFLVKCAAGVQSVVIFVRSWTMEFRRYCLIFLFMRQILINSFGSGRWFC